jgi:hypothetical protein
MCSFLAPQLTKDGGPNPIDVAGGCRPSVWFSLFTAILPNAIALAFILTGFAETPDGRAHPLSYVGCAVAAVGSTWYWGSTGNWGQVGWSVGCGTCYGVGMLLYVRTKPLSDVWGYHEWMHVCVTLGFVLNAFGVQNIADTCPTGQWPTTPALDDQAPLLSGSLLTALMVGVAVRMLVAVGDLGS